MTVIQKKRDSTYNHLSPQDIEEIGAALDAIRAEVIATRGARDAAYIRKVIANQRKLEVASRVVLLFSRHPVAWVIGTAGLTVARIIENTEVGHNVMHGQWDWMRDPKIHSTTYEWDHVSPASQWKRAHNQEHHTYTNVIDRDQDLGYGIMRIDEDQEWEPRFLYQPAKNLANALLFEWGIASYDLSYFRERRGRDVTEEQYQAERKAVIAKARRQVAKDYVLFPLLSGPSALSTLTANLTANVFRNVWTHATIMCGHFPEGVEVFATDSIENETHAQWYVRQMLGSANISGGPVIHLMTGHLSHQIEHHLYPDLPSNRYPEIAPPIQALFARYGLNYLTRPMGRQVYSAWHRIIRLSLPNSMQRASDSMKAAMRPGRARRGRIARLTGPKGRHVLTS